MHYITRNNDGRVFRCGHIDGAMTAQDLGLRGDRTLEVVADDHPDVLVHMAAQEAAEAERLAAEAEAQRVAEEAARAEAAARAVEEAALAEKRAALEADQALVEEALAKGAEMTPEVAGAVLRIAAAGAQRLRA